MSFDTNPDLSLRKSNKNREYEIADYQEDSDIYKAFKALNYHGAPLLKLDVENDIINGIEFLYLNPGHSHSVYVGITKLLIDYLCIDSDLFTESLSDSTKYSSYIDDDIRVDLAFNYMELFGNPYQT